MYMNASAALHADRQVGGSKRKRRSQMGDGSTGDGSTVERGGARVAARGGDLKQLYPAGITRVTRTY